MRRYLVVIVLFGSLYAEEPISIPDFVEQHLQHPDLISQLSPPACDPQGRKPLRPPSPYFEMPRETGGSSGGKFLLQSGGSSSSSNVVPAVSNTQRRYSHGSKVLDDDGVLDNGNSLQGYYGVTPCDPDGEGFTVNFENISVVQLLQFISQIAGVNFIFDAADLQFNITIVSQEAASISELTAALMQILKMHGLSVSEQGNTVLIYKQQSLSRVSKVITEDNLEDACNSAIITRVFRLYNVDPDRIASIVKPLLSHDAVVEISKETRHLIVSDITYNIDKIAQLLNALDTPNTQFEVAEYQVTGAYPEALVAYAKEILAPLLVDNPMQMIAQPSAHKIFLVSTPYLIQKALHLLQSLDSADITDVASLPSSSITSNVMYMYKLKYHPGKDIATALQQIGSNLQYAGVANLELVNAAYSAQFLEVNNSVVVTGTQDAVQKVVSLIDELDQPPKQVYLEVLVIDTTLSNSLDFGVQWIALGDEQNKLAYATSLVGDAPPMPVLNGAYTTPPGANYVAAQGTPPPKIPNPGRDIDIPVPSDLSSIAGFADLSEAFGFGIIGNIISHGGQSFLTLGALISALEQDITTKLVLNPRIMAQDTQPADIFVGQNIPYQTTSSIIQQTGSVTQNIQYEDVGVHLRITPTIAPNNIVSLDIDQTIADLLSTTGTLTPTTSKTLTTTRVHVPDGCFLVMSGHIRDSITTVHSGVPCLGSLPLIGPTFSRTIDQRQKRNLIMFIRPKVVTSIQEELELTNQEGYDANWEACFDSLECAPKDAPECEVYPPLNCPYN